MTGICHHWNAARGYGKITGVDRKQYYAAREELTDVVDLVVGMRVEFTPAPAPRGPRALEVRPIERAGLVSPGREPRGAARQQRVRPPAMPLYWLGLVFRVVVLVMAAFGAVWLVELIR